MGGNGTIEDVIVGVKNLGCFQVLIEKTTANQGMNRPNRAQVMVEKNVPPQLNLTQQFKLEKGDYYSCCAIPNGIMAFADIGNNEIKITQNDGSLKSRVKFGDDEGVNDVTVIGDNHIAASHSSTQTISIINVDEGKVIKTLKTKCNVCGITHHDGYIYFTAYEKGIMKINIETENGENVRNDKSVDEISRIDTDGKILCYTCYDQNAVTVLDSDYKVIFTYKNREVLVCPFGISFDQYQNMIVCSNGNSKLLFISLDGDKVETLVKEADGLTEPTAVHYCTKSETKSIVVVGAAGKVLKYSVT